MYCPTNTASGAAGQLLTMLLQSIIAAPCNLTSDWPEDWGDSVNTGKLIVSLKILFIKQLDF